jgi:acyl-CoA reductase-like NAD-dependent aldehyde dehydrogenase
VLKILQPFVADPDPGSCQPWIRDKHAGSETLDTCRITGYIEHAKSSANTTVLAGGEYDDSVGFYVQPTIVETTTPDDKIFKEEIFGPLLTVLVYKDKVGKGHVIMQG